MCSMDVNQSIYLCFARRNFCHAQKSSKKGIQHPAHDVPLQESLIVKDNTSVSQIRMMVWGVNWNKQYGSDIIQCPKQQCSVTYDQTELNNSDVIIVHLHTYLAEGLPSVRFPHQKWVISSEESSESRPVLKKHWNLFNATCTYKASSDIQTLSIIFTEKTRKTHTVSMHQSNGNPKKLVAWVASHCKTCSQREEYVKMLQKHITVNIYGECGNMKCAEVTGYYSTKLFSSPCFQMINATYLFYLAFENTICDDYMTEKTLRTLELDVVPVVYGGANYSKILPHKSFINIEDFNSAQHLAEYLQYLAQNPEEYREYFQWKKKYEYVYENIYHPEYTIYSECAMCDYFVKTRNDPPRTVNLEEFWSVRRNCRDPFWMDSNEMASKNLIPVQEFQKAFEHEYLYSDCRRCKPGHATNMISLFGGLKQYI